MRVSVLFFLSVVFCVSANAATITGVSGTFSHGQTVTITGTGFGTKEQAAPMQYDDFEEGSSGAVLTTASGVSGWTEITSNNGSASYPHYSTAAAHSGSLGMSCNFDPPVYNSGVNLHNPAKFQHGMYLDAWLRYFRPQNDTRSWKPWDMYGSSGGQGWGNPVIDWFGTCNGSLTFAGYTDIANPSGFSTSISATLGSFTGAMHHLQIWAQPNSPTGASNGVIRIVLDGTQILSRNDMMFIGAGSVNTWARLAIGYYLSHDQQSQPGCLTPVGTGGAVHWDDIYVDNTQQRVEIGNAATYAGSTHREIQRPQTTWNDGAIQIVVNTGTFGSGPAFLYVADSQNNINVNGFPITIGATIPGDNVAPSAPSNLSVQ